jgi:enoyl-CoA hydratase/carnithine racemase
MVAESEPATFQDGPSTFLTVQADLATNDLVVLTPAADGVLRLTLNRPQALNALNRDLTGALEQALGRVAAMDDVRVLLVCGHGRAFCAGNDIKEMQTVTGDEAQALATRHAVLMDRFSRLPQVTLAVIDGHALGGGLMLAAAQDLRIASDRARLGLPEVTLGFNPGYGIARFLDIAGGAHGRDLLLSGRVIHASEALRMGLVNRVVAPPTLDASALKWAGEIAASPREGLAATKEIVAAIRAGTRGGEPEAYGAALRTSGAARARIRAFAEGQRRQP